MSFCTDSIDPDFKLGPLDYVSGISLDGALWRAFYVASKNARTDEHRQLVKEVEALQPVALETYSDYLSSLTADCSFAAQLWRDIEGAFAAYASRHAHEGETFEVELHRVEGEAVCYEVRELGLGCDACLTYCQHKMVVVQKPGSEEGLFDLWLVDQEGSSQVGAPFFNFQLAANRGLLDLRKVA